jgi:long-chain fatty acid transport protein
MGTEYRTQLFGLDALPERSELGVGRLIAPLAYQVNPNFTIAGSVELVWAMLDMRMAVDGAMLGAPGPASLITGGTGTLGAAAVGGAFGALPYMRLDFSDDNDFTGQAKGYGYAGKLGFTYKINPTVTIGGTYHSKTALGDLETSASGTTMTAAGMGTETGKITVRDFEWPETYGFGVAWQATPQLMVAADWKRIGWEDVMKNFKMTYSTGGGLGMTGSVDFALPQNWDDQDVFSLGVAYKYSDALTLRAGANIANNPIPDATMHYLFPAIEENHYTVGFGYAFDKTQDVNFSLSYAPEVKQTNSTFGYTVSHSQTNWQLMYSKKF